MESERQTRTEGVNKWRHFGLIEIPMFLLLCADGMAGTILSDLILYQSCRVTVDKSQLDTCDLLHNNSDSQAAMDLQKLIQPHASYILLCKSLIEEIFPVFLSLFLGPWSDKYGRKPLLVAAFTGSFLKFTMLSVLSNWNMNPWIYLVASTPKALLVGTCGLMLSTFCFISDITNNDDRAVRIGIFESVLAGGLVTGSFTGPPIFQKFGYVTLFGTAALLGGCALFHIIFIVPETVQNDTGKKWGNPIDFSLVKELIQIATKKREGLNRVTLWLSVLILSCYVTTISGEMDVSFLFVSARLGWNAVEYSNFNGIGIAAAIVGTMLALRIFKCKGLSDTSLAVVGATSCFAGAMTTAFTYKPWHMYLALIVGMFSGVLSPPIRSILSKSVPPSDVGKIFSLATSIVSILPLGTNSLYTLMYAQYMPPMYPAPVFLLSGALHLVSLIMITFIDRYLTKDNSPYNTLPEED